MTLMESAQLLGNFGEFFGAIAVLVTLIYLVVQIRQNTASVVTATYESMVSGVTDINLVVVGNSELASILVRGGRDPDSLDYEAGWLSVFPKADIQNQESH